MNCACREAETRWCWDVNFTVAINVTRGFWHLRDLKGIWLVPGGSKNTVTCY